MKKTPIVIALDGPAAAGKGTLGRRLCAAFGFAYLDTGALYRGVAAKMLAQGLDPEDADAAVEIARTLAPEDLRAPTLRDEATGQAASKVSAIPAVRRALFDWQRGFAETPPDGAPGAVLDGRDIGTGICPDADAKIFLTASTEARARRRWLELRAKGKDVALETVLAEMVERDRRDSSRATAPLKPAEDALVIDSSELDAEQVYDLVLRHLGRLGLPLAA